MVEPTESEDGMVYQAQRLDCFRVLFGQDKAELDRFCDAMISIRKD